MNKRLNSISATEQIFLDSKDPYQKALNDSGYTFNLKYEPVGEKGDKKRIRGRKVIYFNPPFSANVSTNIGAKFLRIVDSCIPPGHILRKIINRNSIKVSYRCMPNMKKALGKHNSKIS